MVDSAMSDLPKTFVPGFHDEEAVRKLKYNDFGSTGLKVSHLSLGSSGLSHFYGDFNEEEAILTVQEAIRKGINYIDTAPWYGQGRSEEILGKALEDVPREAYYIGTKIGRYELDPLNMFNFSPEKTMWSVDESLKRLRLDYVDVIQVHDVEFAENIDVILKETLPTLEKVIGEGKARYIGITGYPVSILKDILEKRETSIASVLSYSRMTLIDDTLADFVPYFKTKQIAIINAASLAMGLLTNAGPQPWHPGRQETKDLCRTVAKYCQERGIELGRLAMHHSLVRKGPDTHLVGMNRRDVLNMNLDLLYNGLTGDEKEILAEIKEKYFSKLKNCHWEGMEKYE